MKLLLLPIALALVACQHKPTVPDTPAIPESTTTLNFDRRLLEDCPIINELQGNRDVQNIDFTSQLLNAYTKCAVDKNLLNREVKKAFNIKD